MLIAAADATALKRFARTAQKPGHRVNASLLRLRFNPMMVNFRAPELLLVHFTPDYPLSGVKKGPSRFDQTKIKRSQPTDIKQILVHH